jgi:hypothetical protein
MIVGQEAISVLSPARFLAYMLIPALFSWAISKYFLVLVELSSFSVLYFAVATYWIERCWFQSRASYRTEEISAATSPMKSIVQAGALVPQQGANKGGGPDALGKLIITTSSRDEDIEEAKTTNQDGYGGSSSCEPLIVMGCASDHHLQSASALSPLSPRKLRQQQREALMTKLSYLISSPFPYMVSLLLLAMIAMIFVNVVPIAGLVSVTAVVMVALLVFGSLWAGQEVWAEVDPETNAPLHPHSHIERIESINEFFDSLFSAIDYSLLMIFLGKSGFIGMKYIIQLSYRILAFC